MNLENQNIEWKESWRDEYLKWICGFANSQGGKIIIGKDDKGNVKGVANAEKLLEDIPNKVRDILGIIVDVNLHSAPEGDYLEIVVEAYPYPINYKGQYHYRTGSTKQELKGAALDRFLLQKHGKRWDGVPMPQVAIEDLSNAAFDNFLRGAVKSSRLGTEVLSEGKDVLLEKLHLMEGPYLKRAAILLFHPEPEKFVTGSYIKIGYFHDHDDLLFQDTVHGHLFEQVEKTLDLILTKYLKASIRYEGLRRVETYPFPESALREALLNAVAHKDYSSGNPVQISVYEDKLILWNAGQLPDDWTVEKLTIKHPSIPFNPDVAATFFWAGLIEAWGRGTIRMVNDCSRAKLPLPRFLVEASGLTVEFQVAPTNLQLKDSGKIASIFGEEFLDELIHIFSAISRDEGLPNLTTEVFREMIVALEEKSLLMVRSMQHQVPMKRKDIISKVGLSNQTSNVKRYFEPLLLLSIIAPTIAERPKSRLQQYFLTELGDKIASFIRSAHLAHED